MTTDLGAMPVLVVIDMQRAIDLPGRPARGNPDLDANALRVIAAFRAAGRPIIHVRHDSVDAESWFRPDHPGNAFRPGFAPGPGEGLVVKSVNAAFIGTDLDLRLRRLGATTVVCCGWASDMCVSTTIRVGANMGWDMVCVADACDCSDLPDPFGDGIIPAKEVHRVHMATLAADFCRLVTAEEVETCLRSWKTPSIVS
ncbi:cysteine hydrolase [Siculibacillus lacustris]|uniref:Cysteine hydrolase n=1 Tax=Siculibacillus lacustris TaxID=1549641 RepID=A0A4Q9VSK0_9HYPH|nr:cysteine hydrolase family protein [Siculibacillus lacustris]TBW38636.1 cysteine hydrolase [Siculibacillus lacustris]